jgi:hypothetical protein
MRALIAVVMTQRVTLAATRPWPSSGPHECDHVNSQLPTSNSQGALFEEASFGSWELEVGS